jgi:hypothetical protein
MEGSGRFVGERAAHRFDQSIIQTPPTASRPAKAVDQKWKVCGWLGNLDSNQDKQSQSLLCYRYTIPHKQLILQRFLSKLFQMASQIVPII